MGGSPPFHIYAHGPTAETHPHEEDMSNAVENVFDLDAFGALDTIEYPVHRDGKPEEPIGLVVTLAGNSHPAFQEYVEEEFRRYTKEVELDEAAEAEGKKRVKPQKTLAEMREATAKPVAVRVLSANLPIKFEGEKITLGPTNALRVLSSPRMAWLLNQLATFVGNHENFMPKSAANS